MEKILLEFIENFIREYGSWDEFYIDDFALDECEIYETFDDYVNREKKLFDRDIDNPTIFIKEEYDSRYEKGKEYTWNDLLEIEREDMFIGIGNEDMLYIAKQMFEQYIWKMGEVLKDEVLEDIELTYEETFEMVKLNFLKELYKEDNIDNDYSLIIKHLVKIGKYKLPTKEELEELLIDTRKEYGELCLKECGVILTEDSEFSDEEFYNLISKIRTLEFLKINVDTK